jgi:hypothetical protein
MLKQYLRIKETNIVVEVLTNALVTYIYQQVDETKDTKLFETYEFENDSPEHILFLLGSKTNEDE